MNLQQLTMNIWTCRGKENEKFSNQEMLLTEYRPGHPSTENKFKIHMVNLSCVNHILGQEYSLVVWDFYIHLF